MNPRFVLGFFLFAASLAPTFWSYIETSIAWQHLSTLGFAIHGMHQPYDEGLYIQGNVPHDAKRSRLRVRFTANECVLLFCCGCTVALTTLRAEFKRPALVAWASVNKVVTDFDLKLLFINSHHDRHRKPRQRAKVNFTNSKFQLNSFQKSLLLKFCSSTFTWR